MQIYIAFQSIYVGDLEGVKPFCKISSKPTAVSHVGNESRDNVTFEDLPVSNLGLAVGPLVGEGQTLLKRGEPSQAG